MQTLDEKLKTYEPKLGESKLYGIIGEINLNGYSMLSRKVKKGGFGGGWGKPKKFKSSCGGFTYVKPINGGQHSGFKPVKNFGIGGGGIARKMPEAPFIERYRPPHNHQPYGFHVNGHVILPYGKKKRKIMSNTHL